MANGVESGCDASQSAALQHELSYRREVWQRLISSGGPTGLSPRAIKEQRIHIAQHGVWVDKARTKHLTESGSGVTFAVRHSGRLHIDDLSDDGLIYRYSQTGREGHDEAEIEATKAAGRLELPLFVIIPSPANPRKRDVRLGWVEDWDDASKYFLIAFGEAERGGSGEPEESAFALTDQLSLFAGEAEMRPGAQRFKFRVFKRYGPHCAVCDIAVRDLLDAVHIRPKRLKGSDDPRNGLVFCVLHSLAFEAGLFAVESETLTLSTRPEGPTAEELRLSRSSLKHLEKRPHPEALRWHWRRWEKEQKRAHAMP